MASPLLDPIPNLPTSIPWLTCMISTEFGLRLCWLKSGGITRISTRAKQGGKEWHCPGQPGQLCASWTTVLTTPSSLCFHHYFPNITLYFTPVSKSFSLTSLDTFYLLPNTLFGWWYSLSRFKIASDVNVIVLINRSTDPGVCLRSPLGMKWTCWLSFWWMCSSGRKWLALLRLGGKKWRLLF